MVAHADGNSFETEVLQAKGLVAVDFWAEWCGPCKRYGPIFEEVSKGSHPGVKFVKVDVEAAEAIASEYGIQSIPTTMFFKDGEPVERVSGILSKDQLVHMIAELK